MKNQAILSKAKSGFLYLITAIIALTLVIAVAITAKANTTEHTSHGICGDSACQEAAHAISGEWTALTQAMIDSCYNQTDNAYLLPAGNYYLTENIELNTEVDSNNKTRHISSTISGDINLCLNGKTYITGVINVMGEAKLNICDCAGGGELKRTTDGVVLDAHDTSEVRIFSGTLSSGTTAVYISDTAKLYIEGGSLLSTTTSSSILVYQSGVFTMNGGAITNTNGNGINLQSATAKAYINGGKISVKKEGIHANNSGIEIIMTGGEIEGGTPVFLYGTTTVFKMSGGKLKSTADAASTSDGAIVMKTMARTVLTGAPAVDGVILLSAHPSGSLDVSEYTGNKITANLYKLTGIANSTTVVVGTLDKVEMSKANTTWYLKEETDTSTTPAKTVLKATLFEHTHKVCGEAECTHTGEALTWTLLRTNIIKSQNGGFLNSTDGTYVFPAGNYYLTENIDLTRSSTETEPKNLIFAENVNICLNGYTFILDENSAIDVKDGATLTICDCSGDKGELQRVGNEGKITVEANSTLTVYGGYLTNDASIFINDDATYNQYGGNIVSNSSYLSIRAGTANIYGGSVNSATYGITAYTGASVNIYGGTIKYKKGYGIYTVNNSAAGEADPIIINMSGGTVEEANKTEISSSLGGIWLEGYVNASITGGNIISYTAWAIRTDPIATLVIDPANDSDLNVTTENSNLLVFNTRSGATAEATGSTVIKGGTFVGSGQSIIAFVQGNLTIEGGKFYHSNASSLTSATVSNNASGLSTMIIIKGGSFISKSTEAYALMGSVKVEGSPSFNGVFVTNYSSGNYADFSGYTGTAKIKVLWIASDSAQGRSVVKGDINKLVSANAGWELVTNGVYLEFNHVDHSGDESATCVTAGTCTTCGASYNTEHTYDSIYDTDCNVCGDVRVVNYDISIVGIDVTSTNAGDILEDAANNGGNPTVSYDYETNTLTLNNASLIYNDPAGSIDTIIYSYNDIKIHLIGENTIQATGNHIYGIVAESLIFTADKGGKLSVDVEGPDSDLVCGIYSEYMIIFRSGEITVSSNGGTIAADHNILGADNLLGSTEPRAAELTRAAIINGSVYVGSEYAQTVKMTGCSDYYHLWVAGIQVNENNKDDILGDAAQNGGTPTVSYDPETNTLTLNNANISFINDEGAYLIDSYNYETQADIDLNIHLIGENTVAVYGCGVTAIYTADLTITADQGGKLKVIASDETNEESWGITAYGVLKIDSGEVWVSADHEVLYVDSIDCKYELTGSTEKNASELEAAVFENGYVYINGTLAKTVKIVGKGIIYHLWVGGEKLTDENISDIFGDAANNGGKPTASYDPIANTLTLNNATIDFQKTADIMAAIVAFNENTSIFYDLNIHLIGENVINAVGSDVIGILTEKLRITADEGGKLTINTTDDTGNGYSFGIYGGFYNQGGASLIIESGELLINSDMIAIMIGGGIDGHISMMGSEERGSTELTEATMLEINYGMYASGVNNNPAKTLHITSAHEWSTKYSANDRYHWYVCSGCDSVKDKEAHTFGELVPEVAASCMEEGMKAYYQCTVCETLFDESKKLTTELDLTIAIDENAHAWNEGEITTPATCSEIGTKTFTCTHNAQHTKTEDVAIDENAHAWNEGVITTPATCSAVGTETFTCTHNAQHTKTEDVAIDEDAHTFGEWTQTTAPTCGAKGVETRVCANNAAHKENRDIAALGHSLSEMQSDDESHWNKCSRCEETDVKALHEYSDGICVCGKENGGLSGGAIAGIVIGSTLIAAIGGFSLFWFVIKKKSFADLVSVFKK